MYQMLFRVTWYGKTNILTCSKYYIGLGNRYQYNARQYFFWGALPIQCMCVCVGRRSNDRYTYKSSPSAYILQSTNNHHQHSAKYVLCASCDVCKRCVLVLPSPPDKSMYIVAKKTTWCVMMCVALSWVGFCVCHESWSWNGAICQCGVIGGGFNCVRQDFGVAKWIGASLGRFIQFRIWD